MVDTINTLYDPSVQQGRTPTLYRSHPQSHRRRCRRTPFRSPQARQKLEAESKAPQLINVGSEQRLRCSYNCLTDTEHGVIVDVDVTLLTAPVSELLRKRQDMR